MCLNMGSGSGRGQSSLDIFWEEMSFGSDLHLESYFPVINQPAWEERPEELPVLLSPHGRKEALTPQILNYGWRVLQ